MAYQAVYFSRPLRFVSQSDVKINEYRELLQPMEFVAIKTDVGEPAGRNHIEIVRAKVLKAFEQTKAAVFVDQTGLHLEAWQGLPGGLTNIFWQRLTLTGFLKLLSNENNRKAVAITTIGYCDGKKIHIFQGKLPGTIANEPRGEQNNQWDPVFIPQGETRTFAEMSYQERLKISMRFTAASDFKNHLLKQRGRWWYENIRWIGPRN